MPKHAKYPSGTMKPSSFSLTAEQKATAARIGTSVADGVQKALDAVAQLEATICSGYNVEIRDMGDTVDVIVVSAEEGETVSGYEAATVLDALCGALEGLQAEQERAEAEAEAMAPTYNGGRW